MAGNRPIDEKIVAMKMDNSDLVKKAAETTSIFGKLTNALNKIPGVNLGRTVKDLGDIQRVTNRTDLEGLARSVESVSNRFSAMGIMATTALVNISNRAVNAGIALSKSLGPDQIADGFREYEMKMGSIGTMLANTEWYGGNLKEVKATLGELNEYADKTIYSFSEMTSSVGRFTAAGITLEDSAVAIKGLGNLAAASGSSSLQLNTAMYQMSQALAAGKLNLMDWNSMVNAGMAGKKTQDALLATAKRLGIAVDMSKGFRNSIEQGWLTSRVFLETMKEFGNDATMTEAAQAVRTFTGLMASLKEGIGSGWAETWEHVFGDFNEATKFWTGISKAVNGIFDGMADSRNKLVGDLSRAGAIRNTFTGIGSALTAVGTIFKSIGDAFKEAFPPVNIAKITALTMSFRSFTAGLIMSNETADKVKTVFKGIFSIFSAVGAVIKTVVGAIFSMIPSFEGLNLGILDMLARFSEMTIEFSNYIKSAETLGKIHDFLMSIFTPLGALLVVLGNGFSNLGETISEVWSILSKGKVSDSGPWAEDSNIVGVLLSMKAGFESFGETLSNLNISMEGISGMFTKFFDTIGNGWNWFKEQMSGIGEFFAGIFKGLEENQGFILAGGGLVGLGAIIWRVWTVFSGFSDFLNGMSEGLEQLGESIGAIKWSMHANSMLAVAVSLGIMAVSLKILQGIKWTEMGPALNGLLFSLAGMVGALAVISHYNIAGTMGAALTLVAVGGAVILIASALKRLSDLKPEEIGKGLLGLLGIMGTLSLSVTLMSKFGGKVIGTSALQFIALATSIHIMVAAINSIAKIEPENLKKGLVVIGSILIAIAAFSQLTSGTGLAKTSVGLLLMSAALNALIIPIATLGLMPHDMVAKGLTLMAISLFAMVAAVNLMNPATSMAAGVAITLLAGALNMLVVPLFAFSKMSWEGIWKGLAGVGGSMLLLAGAAALFGVAAPLMLPGAIIIAALGVAALAAGAGMALFGKGLIMLATLSVGAVAAIVGGIGSLITGMVLLLPAATDLFTKIMTSINEVLVRNIPKLVDSFARLILAIMNKIVQYMPKFIDTGAKIITNFLDGIARNAPKVIESATNLIITLINALSNAIRDNRTTMIDSMGELLGEIVILVVEAGAEMITALFGWIPGVKAAAGNIGKITEKYIRENFKAKEVGEDKGKDYSSGVLAKKGDAEKAGEELGKASKKGAEKTDLKKSGEDKGKEFAEGLGGSFNIVKKAATLMASATDEGIRERLDIRSPGRVPHKLGEYAGEGFANGVESKREKALREANYLGMYTAEGISKGAEKKKKSVKKSGESLAEAAKDGFNEEMEKADYRLEMGEINSDKYIAELEKIKRTYSKYPDMVREVNLKIKKAEEDALKDKEEVEKAKLEAVRKRFEAEKNLISDRKYYNNISLLQELVSWQTIMNKYKKGTEERKEAEREVYRLKNEINQKLIAINEDYTTKVQDANKRLIEGERALNEEYDRALRDRTDALRGFMGIFDEVQKPGEETGKKLLDNLKGQVFTFAQWTRNLDKLAKKGIDPMLLEELRKMGPQAANQIAALTTLTDSELKDYSNTWKLKNQLAREEAVDELKGLKDDTVNKISELRKETAKELETYKIEWINKIREIRFGTSNEFVGINTSMTQIGKDVIKGLMDGMKSMEGPLKTEAKKIADTVSTTIKNALKIKSPSRVTMGLGKYVGEGLAIGISKNVGQVADSAKSLALTAKDSLNNFLEGFKLPDGGNELHFKAVIDYTQFDSNRFGIQPIRVSPDTSLTNGLAYATSVGIRQNGDKMSRTNPSTNGNEVVGSTIKQPIIIQSVLNGRIIAEETFGDTNQLLNSRANLDYIMG